MFDWISHNKELFLQSHTEIGVSYQHALDLQTQHNHFAMNSMVSWEHPVNSGSVYVSEKRAGMWGHLQFREHYGPVRGEVRKVRLGCGSSPLPRKQCCSVHPDTDIWLFPRLKSSAVLWNLFTFWKANTVFFKFLTFLWLGINESCRWYFNNLCFSPHALLRYFSKPWKRDTNQAVSCGLSGILAFSVVNRSVLLNATQFTLGLKNQTNRKTIIIHL